ncbi:MAG: carboxypeptidase regulatory-like domain-containing protein [Acidobacteria bacterium]|nr:carboxypeptidase regulatory-like domain-containing protein [Acidobacteriota bacterium]
MKSILLASTLVAAMAAPAAAQSIFATVVGTVTDKSSAVISGARVTIVNVNTNEKREFTSNSAGNYEISNLFPGTYTMEVQMAGFTRSRKEGIALASNENARIDVALEVLTQVTEVTVTADSGARLETESSMLSDVRSFRHAASTATSC